MLHSIRERDYYRRIIAWYLSFGGHLSAMRKATSERDFKTNKKPINNGWNKFENGLSAEQALRYFLRGNNLSFTPPENLIVLDVDGPVGQKCIDTLFNEIPTFQRCVKNTYVVESGNGFHIYFKKYSSLRVRSSFKGMPKIEIKDSKGGITCAGSFHIQKQVHYEIVSNKAPIHLPEELLPYVQLVIEEKKPKDKNNTKYKRLLNLLDVMDYSKDYTNWFAIMASYHALTQGMGKEDFLEWCGGDPDYTEDERVVENSNMWEGLDTEGGITAKTLFKTLIKKGVSQEDIDRFLEETDADTVLKLIDDMDIKNDNILTGTKKIIDTIEKSKVGNINKPYIYGELQKKTNIKISIIKDMKRFYALDTVENMSTRVAELTMKYHYQNGKNVRLEGEKIIWVYKGNYWRLAEEAYIKNKIFATIKFLNPQGSDLAVLLGRSFIIFKALAYRENKRLAQFPPPYMNLKNGEFDVRTCKLNPHNPNHFLTHYIDVNYNPEAKCPKFLQFLYEILEAPLREQEEGVEWNIDQEKKRQHESTIATAEFVLEMLGYAIVAQKPIHAWFLLRGVASGGKSTLMTIIQELVGISSVLSISISNWGKDNHAMAQLPGKLLTIDDDVKAHATVPDDLVKRLSGNSINTANPKSKDVYNFYNTSTIFLLGNNYPKIVDLTDGMRRRAHVVEYHKQFKGESDNLNLKNQLLEEMEGILTILIKARHSLMKRGYFKPPESVKKATKKWYAHSHGLILFVEENIRLGTVRETTSLSNLYAGYRLWSIEVGYGVRNLKNMHTFKESLTALGSYGDRKFKWVRRAKGTMLLGFKLINSDLTSVHKENTNE